MIAPVVPRPKSRFHIGLATPADDAELRALLRRSPVHGQISVTFEREPSFFDSCGIRGDFFQVGIGRDHRSGKIIGLGTRSIADAFVNGVPMPVGYLADLRLTTEYRGGTLIARGYRFLKCLHEDGRARLYTTLIFAGNQAALKTIASGRAGLPDYHDMGVIHSPSLRIRKREVRIPQGCKILRGSPALLPQIVECLNRNNALRQFAPVHTVEMFRKRWRELRAEDFVLAVRDQGIVGVLGCWDQTSFKQTRVVDYAAPLRWLVRTANVVSGLTGIRYPHPGEEVPYVYAGFIAIDHNDPEVFAALLQSACNRAAGNRYLYAILALHERDPLLRVVEDYSRIPFSGRLFCVTFDDGRDLYRALDDRIPYLEAATL